MICEAKKIAKNETSSAIFTVGDIFQAGGFQALLRTVNRGGLLLVVANGPDDNTGRLGTHPRRSTGWVNKRAAYVGSRKTGQCDRSGNI